MRKRCEVVFMLLGKCASMQTSSCALERWYGRWGGGEGPRGEHTPTAYVRLFQNTGQHLVIFYERCAQTRVSLLTSTLIFRAVSGFFRLLRILRIENLFYFYTTVLVEAVRRDRRVLLRTRSRTMPRSFLVKKYFAKQKPNYSELECQNGEFGDFFPPLCLL